MINIYAEISKEIAKQVNENIHSILEMFIDYCETSGFEVFLQGIFPPFLIREDLEKCSRVIYELQEFTMDKYERELYPLHEYALFSLLGWWKEVSDEYDEIEFDSIDEKLIRTEDDEYIARNINDMYMYRTLLFQDNDFLQIPKLISIYRKSPEFVQEFLHINLDNYTDLMPNDIREDYISSKKTLNNQEISDEQLIVSLLHSATKRLQHNPIKLMRTSETELSDYICNFLWMNLEERGLHISREMPGGFAKKVIGEIDFFIYRNDKSLYNPIAVGENKEWGNFTDQLKQLLGYMTENVSFGFTIIFNKSVTLSTVLKNRIKQLEDFYIEVNGIKYFETLSVNPVEGMKYVLVTEHKNPEDSDTFRMYHLIVNANLNVREEAARQARMKKS
ncbi:hypothetical protein ACQCN2_17930 [Brevibacillus ginsengisoli]|uniref:hypothetical protein n=1 Tax=Brevibacillus ginsengisoli TaxID=363854 RepID=UPI003CEC31EA